MIDFDTFQSMPTSEVAGLVRAAGQQVCGFPINGTRRWFALEHPELARAGRPEAYIAAAARQHIEIYRLLFDHGIDTLLTPIIGPDVLQRGEQYAPIIEPGLLWFTESPDMLAFYDTYDVRVRVYGDTRRWLPPTAYAHVLDAFDAIAQRTAAHRRHRLFFGVCAHDPAERVAAIGAEFQTAHGRLPDKDQIVSAYYGEAVAPLSFFIGFGPPAVFDVPLIATGQEDLYFTVSPSLYLDAYTLRAILYDHLYTRRVDEDLSQLPPEDWKRLAEFYQLNRQQVIGLGQQDTGRHFWRPAQGLRPVDPAKAVDE